MNAISDDEDIPAEIDFSGGTRGKFYRHGAQIRLPIHLDSSVQDTLAAMANANAKGIELSVLVNDLLRKDIELIRIAR